MSALLQEKPLSRKEGGLLPIPCNQGAFTSHSGQGEKSELSLTEGRSPATRVGCAARVESGVLPKVTLCGLLVVTLDTKNAVRYGFALFGDRFPCVGVSIPTLASSVIQHKGISQHLCRIRPFALRTDCFPGKTPRLERTGKSRYRPCAVTKAQRSGGTDLPLPILVIQWSSGTVPCCVKRHGFPAGASRRSSSDQLSTTFSCVAADSCSLALIIRNRCPSGLTS